MPFPKKHEQSVIHSVRIPFDVKLFLKNNFSQGQSLNNFTANDFINMLIQNSDEYKAFIAKKQSENNEPKLDFS